ncbi:MAG: metallophosphoesterase family protein, partial [Vicinamibacterales bacterium]
MRVSTRNRFHLALLIAAVVGSACATAVNPVELPPVQPPAVKLPNQAESTRFAVIGDTGTGGIEQHRLAQQLIAAHSRYPFEFVLMTGDNIYGTESAQDFINKFEAPYKPLIDAGVKFYASLGNHDDTDQVFYKPFNMDGKRFYTFKPKADVRVYAIDSNYMSREQIEWLEKELANSDSAWKIAFFHHPLYSSGGRHGSELDLRAQLEPLFLKHGVSVVFSGHEHFYERLKPQKGI